MGATEAFARLNEQQREAAQAGAGPLLIIAGAGTGKTNTLAHRVAHLILQGAQPERILLLTFTRRAALEMTRRAARIVAEAHKAVRLPWSGTFHSVGNRLIRKHCRRLGLDGILQRARSRRRGGPDGRRAPRAGPVQDREALSAQGHLRRHLLAPREHAGRAEDTLRTRVSLVRGVGGRAEAPVRAYVERKLAHQALDYDDLLLYWHAMMERRCARAEIGARSTTCWWTSTRTPTPAGGDPAAPEARSARA
jgi:DNA helicase II / ATP-dependent DNA helicase PcrA